MSTVVFADMEVKYNKFSGLIYNVEDNIYLDNQNLNIFTNYDFLDNNTLRLNFKSNIEELKNISSVLLTRRNDDFFIGIIDGSIEVSLDLTNNDFLLNFRINDMNYFFSDTSRHDIIKHYLENKKESVPEDLISISPMYIPLELVLDGWEIVSGPSITNQKYLTSPGATALKNLFLLALGYIGGGNLASFALISAEFVHGEIESTNYDGAYSKHFYVRQKYADGPGTMSYYQYAWKTVIYSSPTFNDLYLDDVDTMYDGGIRLAED